MTQDEIIEMARQAGAEIFGHPDFATICVNGQDAHDFVEAFAKLIFQNGYEKGVAAFNDAVLLEREACAEVCKKQADVYAGLEQNPTTQSAWAACIDNRDAIRARGQA